MSAALTMGATISVRIRGREYLLDEKRLDAAAELVDDIDPTSSWIRLPPNRLEAVGRALFADDWPAIVDAVHDAPELGRVVTGAYIELGIAAGRLPTGSA